MISLEKWKILTPLQKLPKNVGDLCKLITAKGFKKLPKVQKIAQSGHTAHKLDCLLLPLTLAAVRTEPCFAFKIKLNHGFKTVLCLSLKEIKQLKESQGYLK